MFRTVPGNKKLIALVFLALILVFASFKKSFIPTYESLAQKEDVTEKLTFTKASLSSIEQSKSEVAYLNKKIGATTLSPQEVQQRAVIFFDEMEGVSIVRIQKIHTSANNLFTIHTHQLAIEGTYPFLLKALYEFEKNFNKTRVVHCSFENTEKNGKILANQQLIVTLQNYERIK